MFKNALVLYYDYRHQLMSRRIPLFEKNEEGLILYPQSAECEGKLIAYCPAGQYYAYRLPPHFTVA